ncbi:DHA2 family efflux MFS transporter permease subunit [Pseudonocardia acaciae]|uniref:DHA2 family efflux MFS transporter permease subunit n=1 Tax=Pseudonocardia acaciae TaxID=551276 RepID=UPI0012ED4E21|nr:DHA2 family efflux MFS transporter permease subunit [Pseudonocardia acaciae]
MARESEGEARSGGWVLPLIVLITGMFMSVLDTSIVNVAIPRMQSALGASTEDITWVVTGYTLALGVVVPLSAWLGSRIGVTRLYLASLLGFTVASALCGMAWDLDSMVFFRILQAIPGGILPVVSMTMLYRIVPPQKIGTAMGMYGLGVVFAPGVGPTLGGYLVEYVDWRLIFYINVPVGIIGAIAAAVVLPRVRPTTWPKFDFWGFLFIAYGLFALLLATDKGQDWGWTSYPILILIVSSLFSLALFVVIELEVDAPLLDLRVFKVWPYVNSLLLIGVLMIGMFSTLYYVPQFLQITQGMEALDAGLVMMPSALVMTVMMPIAGKLYDKIGPRWPAVIGLIITGVGSYLTAQITPDLPRADLIWWTVIRNIGVGLCMMPIMTGGLSALPPVLTSAGSAMNNVMQRVSSSVGLAVFGGLITAQQAQLLGDWGSQMDPAQSERLGKAAEQGSKGLLPIYQELQKHIVTTTYANVFLAVTGLCLLGLVLAFMLRSGPARPAAGPPPAPARPAQPAREASRTTAPEQEPVPART